MKKKHKAKITIVSPEFYKTVVPHKEFADKTFGFTDKANGKIYVKRASSKEEMINRLVHEMEELHASKSPHQVEGIRYGFFSDIGDWFQEKVSDPVKETLDPILPESVKDNPLQAILSIGAAPFTGGTSLWGLAPFAVESTAGQLGFDMPNWIPGLASGLLTGASLGGLLGTGWNAASTGGSLAGGPLATYASGSSPLAESLGLSGLGQGGSVFSNASWLAPYTSNTVSGMGPTLANAQKLLKEKNVWDLLGTGTPNNAGQYSDIANNIAQGGGQATYLGPTTSTYATGQTIPLYGGADPNLLAGVNNVPTQTAQPSYWSQLTEHPFKTIGNTLLGNEGGGMLQKAGTGIGLSQLLPLLFKGGTYLSQEAPNMPAYTSSPESQVASQTYQDLLGNINSQDYFKPIQDYLDQQRGKQTTLLRSQAAQQGNLDSTGFMNQLADLNQGYDIQGALALADLQKWGIGQQSDIASQLAQLFTNPQYGAEMARYQTEEEARQKLLESLFGDIGDLFNPDPMKQYLSRILG